MTKKSLLLALLCFGCVVVVQAQSDAIKDYAASFEGQVLWLKVDVIRLQYLLRGTDATNVYPDGNISYRARIGIRQAQSDDAEDFTEEARVLGSNMEDPPKVRLLKRGSQVEIRKVKAEKKEVKIEFNEVGGPKHALRLKFEQEGYTEADIERLFYVSFAVEEAELLGATETLIFEAGMTTEEVIAVRGRPNIQVNLEDKTVLVYDDLKLIFRNNALVDVE